MAAPLPLKTTATLAANSPFSSTPPPASQSTPNLPSPTSSHAKLEPAPKSEGSGLEEPHPTPIQPNSADIASIAPSAATLPPHTSTPQPSRSLISEASGQRRNTDLNASGAAVSATSSLPQKTATPVPQGTQTATSTHTKKQRRPLGEQVLVTLLPKPNTKSTIGALHKPFIIAPTTASVDHLAQLINATLKVDASLEVGWKISPHSDGSELLDRNVTLDWINKTYFIPQHKDILLYFFQE
jgi:hypothetical protein